MFRKLLRFAAAIGVFAVTVPGVSAAGLPNSPAASGAFYQQTNLVADTAGVAAVTDPNLVNPWGIATGPTSPFWLNDNGTGLSTLYNTTGQIQPLVVTVPPPMNSPAGTTSTPTGTVYNGTSSFSVSQNGVSGASVFIFATEDGTISGWAPNVNGTVAILAVDQSSVGAVFKGLAVGTVGTSNFLYATDFHNNRVDMFDQNFKRVASRTAFVDSSLPAGYAPFGIQNIGGNLYVTYARQDAARHDDVPGAGRGFVDVFDTSGNLIHRLISQGKLNAPWGLALAPANFGRFSNMLLVGNFGNGWINAFDPNTGAFMGTLASASQQPIAIDGLWGLQFGNGGSGGVANDLYFTAGPDGEQHGLFGSLSVKS